MSEKNTEYALTMQRASLLNYLLMKQQVEDWHAVADAAMDLREIDAKLEIISELHIAAQQGARVGQSQIIRGPSQRLISDEDLQELKGRRNSPTLDEAIEARLRTT